MPIRSCFLFLLLAFFSADVAAQTFYKSYGANSSNEAGQVIIASPDGNFFVGGNRADRALVMKIDPQGNVIWARTIKPYTAQNYDQCVIHLAITPDNYLIGCGVANGGTPATAQAGFHFKFDLSGNLLWQQVTNDPRVLRPILMLPKSASEYLLFLNYYDYSTAPFNDISTARVNAATGAITWLSPKMDYMSQNPYADDVHAAAIGRGDNVYSTGRIYVNGNSNSSMRAYISKFDGTGAHLWSKYLLKDATLSARIYGIDILYDNDSLMLCYYGDDNGSSSNFTVGLIKADTMGNVAWSKNYDITASSTEFAHKVLRTSYGYAITGHMVDNSSDFFTIAVNPQGNLLWSKKYGGFMHEAVTGVGIQSVLSGTDILFTGKVLSTFNFDENLIIARADVNGLIGCSTSSNIAVTVVNNPTGSYACSLATTATSIPFITNTSLLTATLTDPCTASTLNLGNNMTTCNPVTLNATMSGAVQYVWQDGSTQATYVANSPGTYWAKVRVGCCWYSDTIVISGVNASANFSFAPAGCGSTIVFTNTSQGSTSYQWDFGDGFTSTASSPSHVYAGQGAYTVTLIASNACEADTITQTVNVQYAAITAAMTASGMSCAGSVNFSSTSPGANSWQWDFGDGNTSVQPSPSHAYGSAGTYTVTLIASNGCLADTVVQAITFSPALSAQISGDDTICPGQSATLTASGGTTAQWSGGSTATTTSITVSPAATTTYYAVVSDSLCSSAPDTFTVFVAPAPAALISGPDSICAGQNVTLSATGGSAYQWSGGANDTTAAITVSPAVTTTYYVTASGTLCTGAPDTFTVIVTPAVAALISGPDTICAGQSATLSASGGSSYQWSGGSSATTSSITVSPVSTTTYYVTGGSMSCPGTPDTLTLAVLPAPAAGVSGDTLICAGQSTTLTASGGSAYQWSGGSSDTTASITVSPGTTTTYFVTTGNGFCSSTPASITVIVMPPPAVTISGPTAICPNMSATLTASGASSYVWAGTISATGPSVTASMPGNYFVIGSDSLGCSDTAMVTLTIYDVPTVAVLGDDTICAGESAQLTCTGAGTFTWSPATGLSSTSASQVIATPTATITYSVTVTSQQGCVGTDTFTLFVDPCTGVEENSAMNEFALYPNPSSGMFTVEWLNGGSWSIEIYDTRGRLVHNDVSARDTVRSLDLRALPDGVYFLKASGENNYTAKRLVIAR